mmetsp:Transcript_35266/g.91867  ORF Transcript_35266/g.91867 Transcript_35266/m.91867 type:complete len:86 (+) Transcript_35266:41-298(+)
MNIPALLTASMTKWTQREERCSQTPEMHIPALLPARMAKSIRRKEAIGQAQARRSGDPKSQDSDSQGGASSRKAEVWTSIAMPRR